MSITHNHNENNNNNNYLMDLSINKEDKLENSPCNSSMDSDDLQGLDGNCDFDEVNNMIEEKLSIYQPKLTNKALELLTKSNKSNKIKIKTLNHGVLTVDVSNCYTIHDLKTNLCKDTAVQPNDIILIGNGKQLLDNQLFSIDEFNHDRMNIFALIRTKANTSVKLLFKGDVTKDHTIKELNFPLNTRIFHLKRELYSKKITSLRPGSQRLIINGSVVSDNLLLGDYILKSKKGNQATTIYISKTLNIQHEVDISIKLKNFIDMKFSMEISLPTIYIREILYRQYKVPKDLNLVVTMLISDKGVDRWIDLHPAYTLIDYGISNNTKSIKMNLELIKNDDALSNIFVPQTPAEALSNNKSDNSIVIPLDSTGSRSIIISAVPDTINEKASVNNVKAKEESHDITDTFKGMKKGFIDNNKSKSKQETNNNTSKNSLFNGLKKGFLTSSSKKLKTNSINLSNNVTRDNSNESFSRKLSEEAVKY